MNPYESPRPRIDRVATPTSGSAPWYIYLTTLLGTSVAAYVIGRYGFISSDGSGSSIIPRSIANLIFFVALFTQPTTTFGIHFCMVYSSIIWGFLGATLANALWRRIALMNNGEQE